MAKFDKEIFDKVKKGDSIKVTFDSGINRGSEKELLVKSKNLVGKGKSYESEKITFSNVANPNGVKYYAYKRKDGSVGFAIGDMAISNVQIAEKYAKGSTVKGVGDKYYVIDAKSGDIVSKGFDTEEEAKVEKFRIFEENGNFFLTQKKMAKGGNTFSNWSYSIGGL